MRPSPTTGQCHACSPRRIPTRVDPSGIIRAARNPGNVRISATELAIAVAHRVADKATDLPQPVCTENSNPEVMMVKPAQDGVRTYETGSLNPPRIRRIFV